MLKSLGVVSLFLKRVWSKQKDCRKFVSGSLKKLYYCILPLDLL